MFILNTINYLLGLIQHHAWQLMGTHLTKLSSIIQYSLFCICFRHLKILFYL
jgi:hypothetical protein